MNKKHGLLFGFAVIAIAAMVSFTGCPTEDDGGGGGGGGGPAFPAVWAGEPDEYGYAHQSWDPTVEAGTSKPIGFSNTSWGNLGISDGSYYGRDYRLTGAVTGEGIAASGTFKVKRVLDLNGNLGEEFTVTYEYSTSPTVTLKLTTSTGAAGYDDTFNPDDPFKGGVIYAERAD
jgi:hypothetical protein